MRKFWKKIISYVLIVVYISLCMPVLSVYADESYIFHRTEGFEITDILSAKVFEKHYGIAGKPQSDECMFVSGTNTDMFIQTGYLEIDKSKTYIFEVSVLPVDKITTIFFATRYHSRMSPDISPSQLIGGCWNKLQFVFRPETGTSNLYINGEDTGTVNVNSSSLKYCIEENQGLRFVLLGNSGLSAYIDNISIYTADDDKYDVFSDITVTDSTPLHFEDNSVYVPEGMTVDELNSAIVSDKLLFVNKADGNDAISEGDTLVITNADNISREFAVEKWGADKSFEFGDAVFRFNRCIEGNMYSKAICEAGSIYAVCQYDSSNNLIGVNCESSSSDGVLSVSYDVKAVEGSFLKILKFGKNLAPKISPIIYKYGIDNIKTKAYAPKSFYSVIEDENFDVYEGSAIGNSTVISRTNAVVTAADDILCGGKYLHINKTKDGGNASVKKFFEPNGGNLRFDMQLAIFNDDVNANLCMSSFNHYDTQSLVSNIMIDGNKLYALDTKVSKILLKELEVDEWYDLSVYYNSDGYAYDVYIDGECVASDVPYRLKLRTLECLTVDMNSAGFGSMGIDNIRLSHIEYGEWVKYDSEKELLYEDDFDDIKNDTILVDDVAGDIYHRTDGTNGYIEAQRHMSDGTCSKMYYYNPLNDNVIAECEVYVGDLTGATKLISICGDSLATVFFSGSNLHVLGRSGRPVIKSDVQAGRWYKLKMVTNMAKSVFEVYLDGVCLTKSAEYQTMYPTSNSGFRFAITAGGESSFRLDNLKISRYHIGMNIEHEPAPIDTYKPDKSAPSSYEWQNIYNSAPTGMIYEAEVMNLTNYTVIADTSYNGGYYIQSLNDGYSVAEFAFDGDSGYYGINIGYGESKGKYDSFFELNRNGERLDWWIGQFDDGAPHIRESKRYVYVNNGDVFSIIGNGCRDSAKLDYVEFVKADKIEEFAYGDLTEDDTLHPVTWLSSSWDSVEDGGYARYDLTLYDIRNDAHCELIRNVYPFYKNFTLDYTLKVSSAKDCHVLIGDGEAYPISYKFSDNAITVGTNVYENAYAVGKDYKYRISVDADNKRYTLLVNGIPLAQNIPFDGDVDKFTQLRFISSDKGISNFKVTYVKMTAGYELFETFRPYAVGTVPYDWNVSAASAQDMPSEGADRSSLRISEYGYAGKAFDTTDGKITYEAFIMMPQKKDGVMMQIGQGDRYIGFYTKDGHIYYDTDTGEDKPLWNNYKQNIWYTLRIELDTDKKAASYFVNDFCKAENIPVSLDCVDNVNFVSGDNSGYLWIDDISVVNSIYETTVPEPQVPELKDDYTIVMETCDLWREGNHFGWDSLVPFDNRTPFLGYLEDGNVEVTDWETKFMAEHGITTYVPCWYMNNNYSQSPIKDPRNSAKLHAFLKSDYCEYLDFAILLTNTSTSGGVEVFLDRFVDYWIERYFKAPNYWKIDNKPVIPMFDTSFVSQLSGSDKGYLYSRIEERLIENGFDGVVLIGRYGAVSSSYGFSYKYQYHQGNVLDGTTVIKTLLNGQSNDGVGFIASPSQGWGNEPWGRDYRKYNVPLDQWYGSLEWIRDKYMPSQTDKVTSKTLWLGNWNEYAEGHSLAPTRLTGFGYLDGVRKVFTNGELDHYDELPDKHYDYMTSVLW